MTGPEHYREAERLLSFQYERGPGGVLVEQVDPESIALAQVHATLALAAATAQNIRRNGPIGIATTGWEDALQDGGQS